MATPTQMSQLKHPLVLVHGLGARSTYGPVSYFYGLPKLLQSTRNRFYVAKLTPFHTIDYRAQQLKEQIQNAFPDEKVNLIAHSMGGLDSRYMTSRLGVSNQVASITSIGTPHRGSSIGDIAMGTIPSPAFKIAQTLFKFTGSSPNAFQQITRKFCTEQMPTLAPNMPGVAYFSATSAIASPLRKRALPIFWLSHQLLSKLEGDNDGFVSVESSRWGDEIFTDQGDHYAQIGQLLGRSRGMDYMSFYKRILGHLRKQGF